jgi:hypothetical protein
MRRDPAIMICVGATKSGTSWLYEQLAGHRDCHFRSIKELHYFDTVQSGRPEARIREHKAEKDRLKQKLAAAAPAQKPRLRRRIADLRDWVEVLSERAENLDAYRGYLLAGRDGQAVVGEVTPAYATLPQEALRRIAGLADDVRIVYLMRDPVARMWSHVRMLARREATDPERYAATAARKFEAVVTGDPVMEQRGDYAAALAKLRSAVAPERLLTLFSEEMMTPPGMARLWAFLGLAPVTADFGRRIWEGAALAMTEDQRARARTALMPQYEYVAAAYPALPAAWRKSMEEVAA